VSGKKAGLLGLAGCFCAAVLLGTGIMTQKHQVQKAAGILEADALNAKVVTAGGCAWEMKKGYKADGKYKLLYNTSLSDCMEKCKEKDECVAIQDNYGKYGSDCYIFTKTTKVYKSYFPNVNFYSKTSCDE